jgi:inner membrane protein
MDIGTHALASLALSRAFFPRAPKVLWAWTIPAGVVADADTFSFLAGPAAYLNWHRTYSHSMLAAAFIATLLSVAYRTMASAEFRARLSVSTIFAVTLLVQLLHLAMDSAQWQGVELLWPVHFTRVAADWLPTIDPWILTILIIAILLPEFFHLISSEIGAKDKKPRGRVAGVIGLLFVTGYIALRADLHSVAIAQLQNRTYVSEIPTHVAAFSEFTSLVTWEGLAETESALHQVSVRIGTTRASALDQGLNLFKPEASPLLQAAQSTETARRFLRVARFPKATVEKMDTGTEIQIRDLRYAAANALDREPMLIVDFDLSGKITSENITWASRDTPR